MYRLPEHYHHSLTSDHLIKPGSPCSQPWKCLPGSDVLSSPKPTPSSILFSASFRTLQWAEKDKHERANVSLLLPNPHLPDSCCFPRQVHEPLQFSVVLGHAVRAGSCTDGPKQMQLHHSSQHITQIQNKIRMASVHCTQHSCVPLGTSLDREDRKKWSPPQLLPEEQARTQPPLFTILTTFLSCWLSIQLCP